MEPISHVISQDSHFLTKFYPIDSVTESFLVLKEPPEPRFSCRYCPIFLFLVTAVSLESCL